MLGVYRNVVVTAFDVDSWSRGEDGRVTFAARPSGRVGRTWSASPSREPRGTQGQARPVKVLPTAALVEGDAAVEETPDGPARRGAAATC